MIIVLAACTSQPQAEVINTPLLPKAISTPTATNTPQPTRPPTVVPMPTTELANSCFDLLESSKIDFVERVINFTGIGFLAEIESAYGNALAENAVANFWQVFADTFRERPGNQVRGKVSTVTANGNREPKIRLKVDGLVLDYVTVNMGDYEGYSQSDKAHCFIVATINPLYVVDPENQPHTLFYPLLVGVEDNEGLHPTPVVNDGKFFHEIDTNFSSSAEGRSITSFIYMSYNRDGSLVPNEWQDDIWGNNPVFPYFWDLIRQSYIADNFGDSRFLSSSGSSGYFVELIEEASLNNLSLIGNQWHLNPEN